MAQTQIDPLDPNQQKVTPPQPAGAQPSANDTGISQPAAQPANQQPAAQPPDQAGIQNFQTWAQGQFGRQATPEELQQIASQVGYTGGTITPEQLTSAQAAAT